jgi:hypothetical protein
MQNAPDQTLLELLSSSPELTSDRATMAKLSAILKDSLCAQDQLATRFEKKQLSPEEFQYSALDEHARALNLIKSTIGPDRFYRIFGPEGDHPKYVADPQPFYKAFS